MKKQISITLAAIMLAGLTACGTSTPAASSEATGSGVLGIRGNRRRTLGRF